MGVKVNVPPQVAHRGAASASPQHHRQLECSGPRTFCDRAPADSPVPFVFGRGGEEAEELAEAGIPFDMVPGISAALDAAASARIPLTLRDHRSDVTFAIGHDLLGCRSSRSDWPRIPGSGTLVPFMASGSLGPNLARLVEQGRPASTPADWNSDATRSNEKVIAALATLADAICVALTDPRWRARPRSPSARSSSSRSPMQPFAPPRWAGTGREART
jgi:hypothetical protein